MNIEKVNAEIQVIASNIDAVELAVSYDLALEEEMNEYNAMLFACEASYDADASYYGEMQ